MFNPLLSNESLVLGGNDPRFQTLPFGFLGALGKQALCLVSAQEDVGDTNPVKRELGAC